MPDLIGHLKPYEALLPTLSFVEIAKNVEVHRHMKSSETVVCLRGHLREVFYDADGRVVETIDLIPGGPVVGLCVPIGQWHTVEVLESGTVILEVKDGAYESLGEEDILTL